MRVQPDWADVEAAWFEAEERLAQASGLVEELLDVLTSAAPEDVLDRDAIASEAGELIDSGETLRRNISKIVGEESKETICWITLTRREAAPSLSSAPLAVAETLQNQTVRPEGERGAHQRDAQHRRQLRLHHVSGSGSKSRASCCSARRSTTRVPR